MYDWANSAMIVVVVTAIFPIFFASYAGVGLSAAQVQFRFSATTTLGCSTVEKPSSWALT